MMPTLTIQGRSLYLNILFVLLNIIGLAFVVCSFISTHKSANIGKWIGFSFLLISLIGIIIFKGRLMMSAVSRVLVGSTCIASGLIKANDPIGFSYKLKEYFRDEALAYHLKEWFDSPSFSFDFFAQYALIIGFFICVLEITLGVLLLMGQQIKLTAYFLLIMLLFFTFLTWQTASCNKKHMFVDQDQYVLNDPIAFIKIKQSKFKKDLKIIKKESDFWVIKERKRVYCVSDCGCFGDAMRSSVGRSLTPDEFFWKDIILIYFSIWIFLARRRIKENTFSENSSFLLISIAILTFFSWLFSWYALVLFALLFFVGALWIRHNGGRYLGNLFGSFLMIFGLATLLIWYVIAFEPLKDFSPYAVGNHLIQKMNDGDSGSYQNELTYRHNKNGKTIQLDADSKTYIDSRIWNNKNWRFVKNEQKIIREPKLPSITEQFNPTILISEIGKPEKELSYVSSEILKAQKSGESEISIKKWILQEHLFLLLNVNDLPNADWSRIDRIKSIYSQCKMRRIPFVMLTSASRKAINLFRKKYNFQLPVFENDQTELKTISRSNPALLVLKKAVVRGKYSHRSLPTFERLYQKNMK